MEPFEREDYQDLMSEIDNLPSPPPPPPPPVVSAPVVEEEPVFTRALPTSILQEKAKRTRIKNQRTGVRSYSI